MPRILPLGVLALSFYAHASQSSDKPSPIIRHAKQRPASPVPGSAAQPASGAPETGTAVFYLPKQDDADQAPSAGSDLRAAHPTYPFGTRLKVTNLSNNKSVLVIVNDRIGETPGIVISVSRQAAEVLGFVKAGTTQVRVEPVSSTKDPAKK